MKQGRVVPKLHLAVVDLVLGPLGLRDDIRLVCKCVKDPLFLVAVCSLRKHILVFRQEASDSLPDRECVACRASRSRYGKLGSSTVDEGRQAQLQKGRPRAEVRVAQPEMLRK